MARGRSHHAIDDAATLVGVVARTWASSAWCAPGRRPWCSCWAGSAWRLALDAPADPSPEERVLRDLALPAALGRYGGCLEAYAEQAAGTVAPAAEELIERLGGQRLLERMRTERPVAERYPASAARLAALVERQRGADAGREHRAAAGPRGAVPQRRLPHRRPPGEPAHAARHQGARVLAGVHRRRRGQPDARRVRAGARRPHEIQEARRLLYVGMTRAKDRLVLTRSTQREGRPTGGDLFLREAGLVTTVLD